MTNENQKGSTLLAEDATEEMVESSESIGTKGLQQHFAPVAVAEMVAGLSGRANVLDLTAGDGSLLQCVEPQYRFGVEIDKTQISNAVKDERGYTAIQGDLQVVAPLLGQVETDFPFLAINPPYGLDWEDSSLSARLEGIEELKGKKLSSTLATWMYANDLMAYNGQGVMIIGKNRYESEIKPTIGKVEYQGHSSNPEVYAELTVPDMWEEVGVDIVVVLWVGRNNQGNFHATPPLQLTVAASDLGTHELIDRVLGQRGRFCSAVDTHSYAQARDIAAFDAVQIEHDIITSSRRRRSRNDNDLYAISGRVKVNLKPFTNIKLQRENRNLFYKVKALDRTQLVYFAMHPKEWHDIVEAQEAGQIRVDPKMMAQVEEIIETNHKQIVPMYELKPQQRLAYLKDISMIECIKTDKDAIFTQGESYPVVVDTAVVETSDRQRPTVNEKTGEVKLKDFVQVRKLLRIRIGSRRFSEEKTDIEFIVEHFAVPNPGTVTERYPEEYQAMRKIVGELSEGRSWDFREFQLEDLSRLMIKGDGLLAWEQGLGKTLAGLTFYKAHEKLGQAKKGLIIAPQTLIPQWLREAKKFYGLELKWLRTWQDFRECRDEMKAPHAFANAGTGLYITHFEALSRTSKVDGAKHALPNDMRWKYKLATEPAERKWDETGDETGDGQPGWIEIPAKQFLQPVTAVTNCPGCGAHYLRDGWVPGVGCKNCGWVHTARKVKPHYNLIKNAFREGVLIIDELTLIKGESDRSRALRGIKARYVLGMTGTPVKNYIPDAFWGLWKCLGNSTPRFPYAYKGGKTQFENNFAVVEFETTGYKRRGRKVLPEVTNLSALWRLLSSAIIRRRKEETGEDLVARTFYEVNVPWGAQQKQQYRKWLLGFGQYYANENPDDPIVKAGAQDRLAAMLGQLHKLEFATTMPEVDYERDYWNVEVSNWTPKNAKVLEIAMYHAKQGEKVLIGSAVKKTALFLSDELNERLMTDAEKAEENPKKRKLKALTILDKDGNTKSPPQQAKVVETFQDGDANVLCASVQAMSLGHNLDKANVVILTGLPWDWAGLDQFIARVHRLTSTKDVKVYILLVEGSLDEKKWKLLVKKGAAASLALDGRLIEEDEQKIDKSKFLQELKDAGISTDGDTIEESAIEAQWAEIKSVADIGELDLTPTGDIGDIEIDDRAVPTADMYDEPIGPEPDPSSPTCWVVAHGNGHFDRIAAYTYYACEQVDSRHFPTVDKCTSLIQVKGAVGNASLAEQLRDRLHSGAYGAEWYGDADMAKAALLTWVDLYDNRELYAKEAAERRAAELAAQEAADEAAADADPGIDDNLDADLDDGEDIFEEDPEEAAADEAEVAAALTKADGPEKWGNADGPPVSVIHTTPATPPTVSDDFTFGF